MHTSINEWISTIIDNHQKLLSLAMSQRAKFEGWLKFELAEYAMSKGATEVEIEPRISKNGLSRADLAFTYDGIRVVIELKTPNTNYRMSGVENRTRPITKNINSIQDDINKLRTEGIGGVIAFVLFPINIGDDQWKVYLERIIKGSGNIRNEDICYSRNHITLTDAISVEAVVVTIRV